jgi:hypothetical protein
MNSKGDSAMKTYVLCAIVGFILVTPSLVAQTHVATPTPIPEEARKHFVMGETMFKEAKNTGAFTQAANEFTEAARLAPQWPEARYNLALAKEAAGDYSGAMTDLKLYQQFKLTDAEARTVQDKIYTIEAKQKLQVSDNAAKESEQYTKKIMAAQENFPDLIHKLRGAVFANSEGEMYFVITPFQIDPDYTAAELAEIAARGETPFLKCQYKKYGTKRYSVDAPVHPKSNNEFDGNLFGCGYDFTISSDGRALTHLLSDGTKEYFQKRE